MRRRARSMAAGSGVRVPRLCVQRHRGGGRARGATARDSMAVAREISSVAAQAPVGGRVCEAAARGSTTASRQIAPVAARGSVMAAAVRAPFGGRELTKLSGGLEGGADPPAFQRAEKKRLEAAKRAEEAAAVKEAALEESLCDTQNSEVESTITPER
ncbi:unnamed protein product [Miscanthus lutarioriparius]|uniref:Uncharacterized protein n=1 Tax=Miscanthus lutarioriparius TaxID=422564 RepID=A0A811RT60_9POAL|nr:unnamed protein product [Miscanthus lutarioriparius]